jgi:hypothetical protein
MREVTLLDERVSLESDGPVRLDGAGFPGLEENSATASHLDLYAGISGV